jgi:hypothetical protein
LQSGVNSTPQHNHIAGRIARPKQCWRALSCATILARLTHELAQEYLGERLRAFGAAMVGALAVPGIADVQHTFVIDAEVAGISGRLSRIVTSSSHLLMIAPPSAVRRGFRATAC